MNRGHWQRILGQAALIAGCALVPAALASWVHPRRPTWTSERPAVIELTVAEVARLKPTPLWIDARSGEAYAANHVPLAVLLNEDHWEELLPAVIARWNRGSAIVVYCDSEQCHASQQVALRIQRELKLQPVYVLAGGWKAWVASR